MGVVVAQMSKISHVVRPDHYPVLAYKACICQGASVVIILIGTSRFFCEQSAVNGTGRRSAQWSLLSAGLLVLLVGMEFFVVSAVANDFKLSCSFFIMLITADTRLTD